MKFTQKQILDLVPDLKVGNLRAWHAKGLIKIEDQNPGRGKIRTYTWPEVISVNVMTALFWNNLPPSQSSQVADVIKERFINSRPQDFLVQGDDFVKWDLSQEFIFFNFRNGKLFNYKFIKKKDISFKTLDYIGSYFNYGYMIQRLAEELLQVI